MYCYGTRVVCECVERERVSVLCVCCVCAVCVCLYDFGRFHDIHLFPSHVVKSFFSYAHVLKYAYAEKKLLPRERKKSENIREIVQKSHIHTFCTHFVLNKKQTLRVRGVWAQQK